MTFYFKSDLADKKRNCSAGSSRSMPEINSILFYKKIYPDVRMVAAPPSSIGKVRWRDRQLDVLRHTHG